MKVLTPPHMQSTIHWITALTYRYKCVAEFMHELCIKASFRWEEGNKLFMWNISM